MRAFHQFEDFGERDFLERTLKSVPPARPLGRLDQSGVFEALQGLGGDLKRDPAKVRDFARAGHFARQFGRRWSMLKETL